VLVIGGGKLVTVSIFESLIACTLDLVNLGVEGVIDALVFVGTLGDVDALKQ